VSVRVKICGITNAADAETAVEAGADALGFIFFERSKRYLAPAPAGQIIRKVPPFVTCVGVFVNASKDEIHRAAGESGIGCIQLHGEETPEFASSCQGTVIKAFAIRGADSLHSLREYQTSAFLLDTWSATASGGTGQVFNWEWAIEAKGVGKPIILAGGLTPDNVAQAVQQVRPYAVDVSSGVELSPGRKNPEKVRRFIEAVKAAG
jgi:phosphoribosylanthranilate isomerase